MSAEVTRRTLHLPALLHVETYSPGLWDLPHDADARHYWSELFANQAEHMLEIVEHYRDQKTVASARRAVGEMNRLLGSADDTWLASHATVHDWTVVRERLFIEHGLVDAYAEIKQEANTEALKRLPAALAKFRGDGDNRKRLDSALAMVFEGNLFDHGSPGVARLAGTAIPAMKWLVDDRGRLASQLANLGRDRQATILVDNAGPDFVLGIMTLTLVLCDAGFQVVLAANEQPSLNDVTYRELPSLLARVGEVDTEAGGYIANGNIRVVSTGGGTPGIDLRSISPDLAEAVSGSDLLVLEGQGRAIETNWNARFDMLTLRIATLKDPEVARAIGGSTYDFVCDLRGAGAPPPRLVNQK